MVSQLHDGLDAGAGWYDMPAMCAFFEFMIVAFRQEVTGIVSSDVFADRVRPRNALNRCAIAKVDNVGKRPFGLQTAATARQPRQSQVLGRAGRATVDNQV